MRALRFTFLPVIAGLWSICPAANERKPELPPFTHQYVWQEFTMTKEAPFSDNRHYRLKEVRRNGEVELIDCTVAKAETKVVIVKPAPKKLKDGDRPPTIVVIAANHAKQSATIRELRIK